MVWVLQLRIRYFIYICLLYNSSGGEDYRVESSTVVLTPGDMNAGFVTITIINDALIEEDEEFVVHLATIPGSGASLNSTSTSITVTIKDDEGKCCLEGFTCML